MSSLILLNKPYKVLSQFTDDGGRSNLSDFIDKPSFYPAGRLDFDSEGLLLLTDDGKVQHHIAHPSRKMPKTYWVQVEGLFNPAAIEQLQTGVLLKDGLTKPAKVKHIAEPNTWHRIPPVRYRQAIPTHWLEISITEGRNRQVRRMTAAVNLPTLRLIRRSIGQWSLEDLMPGESCTKSFILPLPTKARANKKKNNAYETAHAMKHTPNKNRKNMHTKRVKNKNDK
jgi:23S rRNA pseudouridine2457 synthase